MPMSICICKSPPYAPLSTLHLYLLKPLILPPLSTLLISNSNFLNHYQLYFAFPNSNFLNHHPHILQPQLPPPPPYVHSQPRHPHQPYFTPSTPTTTFTFLNSNTHHYNKLFPPPPTLLYPNFNFLHFHIPQPQLPSPSPPYSKTAILIHPNPHPPLPLTLFFIYSNFHHHQLYSNFPHHHQPYSSSSILTNSNLSTLNFAERVCVNFEIDHDN